MIRNLVAFGDSWIYGDEIYHPDPHNATSKEHRLYREQHCLVGCLARNLNLTVENYGVSGSALSVIPWEMHRWLHSRDRYTDSKPNETLVVVGLTECLRESWFDAHTTESSGFASYAHTAGSSISGDPVWEQFKKLHYTHVDCTELQRARYWQTTEFVYNWCKTNGAKLLMFNIFRPPYVSPYIVNPTDDPDWNTLRWLDQNPEYRMPGHHPNENGCQELADILTPYARAAIIAE